MATTTEAAICERIITVIGGLVPASHRDLRFIAHRDELDADFERWAVANPPSCTRRFQVSIVGDSDSPFVSNGDVSLELGEFEIVVAYSVDHRFGAHGARSRRAVMKQDQRIIEAAVGMLGRANFSPPDHPDACWVGGVAELDDGKVCDFLIIRQTMQFYLAR